VTGQRNLGHRKNARTESSLDQSAFFAVHMFVVKNKLTPQVAGKLVGRFGHLPGFAHK